MSEIPKGELTEFDYLLNRFERASQAEKPAEMGYGEHRRALYAYARKLEAAAALRRNPGQAGDASHLDTLDFNRLREGGYRMLNPANQPIADALASAWAVDPVAWASSDWMRAITETELALIPNTGKDKGRRDRCRLIYPTPLYTRAAQAELDAASDAGRGE